MDTSDRELITLMGSVGRDPLGFVLLAFPWGKGELAAFPDGPDVWQREVLEDIGASLQSGSSLTTSIQEAVASGHGVGKSALVAWIILWAVSTFPDTRGVVTANTENQLRTKTWAELAKWHRLCLTRTWFECTATALISNQPGHEKTWRVDMTPWSERNTEAFAGLHNQGRRVLLIFDEASAIPDVVWEVSEGALTDADTEIIWCAFGNPTRNTGRFRECFGRFRHRWHTRQIDSRTARMTNKAQLQQWIDDYGADSDFVKVRVLGEFPSAGETQFIPVALVDEAMERRPQASAYAHAPLVMGVDVARFGSDSTVITFRRGLLCEPQIVLRDMDTMRVAGLVAQHYTERHAQAVFVDGVGVGAGVVDRLRQLGIPVVDAQAGARALDPAKYANRRAEMWGEMRDWLSLAFLPPGDRDLKQDLTGVEYGFTSSGALQLEKKEDMKKRGLASPDRADSLALTFYSPVAAVGSGPAMADTTYDPLAW
ncbi:terminase [uncultured Mailhella sp.]|uniref:terminase n=1 Tax=uncultured Mailhella sp. TaxID=1981031 RepID=UPI002626CC4F|nr:terminase [uncultured Mailhella sp.]